MSGFNRSAICTYNSNVCRHVVESTWTRVPYALDSGIVRFLLVSINSLISNLYDAVV